MPIKIEIRDENRIPENVLNVLANKDLFLVTNVSSNGAEMFVDDFSVMSNDELKRMIKAKINQKYEGSVKFIYEIELNGSIIFTIEHGMYSIDKYICKRFSNIEDKVIQLQDELFGDYE